MSTNITTLFLYIACVVVLLATESSAARANSQVRHQRMRDMLGKNANEMRGLAKTRISASAPSMTDRLMNTHGASVKHIPTMSSQQQNARRVDLNTAFKDKIAANAVKTTAASVAAMKAALSSATFKK